MKRALAGLAAAAFVIGSGAWAQEAIPTAANAPGDGAPPPTPTGASPTMISDQASEHDDRGPLPIGPCGAPYKQTADGQLKQDKNPHGEVWGAVGTHNFHDVGGAVCIPVGKESQVTIAVDQTQWGRR